jgi:predicted transcriptional regulator
MIEKTIQIFDEKEEEFLNLLISVGIQKKIASIIVFFASTPEEVTSRDIEHGTDLRQPEVSLAVKYMAEQGWIKIGEKSADGKGRPSKTYSLTIPVMEIISGIEKQKKNEAKNQLALVKKMRDYA